MKILLAAAFALLSSAAHAQPQVIQDCADCPSLVVVPAGTFLMGSPESEPERDKDESPQHQVTFAKPFAISRHEVTRGHYAAFVRATKHESAAVCSIWAGTAWQATAGKTWRDPGYVQADDHPVVCVNWDDAAAYATWLSRATNQTYRLPTEAEWEYAARGGTTTPYFFGANPDDLCQSDNGRDLTSKDVHVGMAWPPANCRDGYAETAPVGSFKPNPFGLHDVHGNVWEWIADCYSDSYVGAPADGRVVDKPGCAERVYRGGGWSVEKRGRRAANRGKYAANAAYAQLGLRVVRDLK